MPRSIPAVLVATFIFGQTAAELDPVCRNADDAFEKALHIADEVCVKSKRDAAATRQKTYKSQLSLATKAGDFDRATAIKAALDQIENDTEHLRPRPKETTAFGGRQYAIIRELVTWHVAKARCEQMGGRLACLESSSEVEFITEMLRKSNVNAWVGASDEMKEGDWKWINGKPAKLGHAKLTNAYGCSHHLAWNRDTVQWTDALAGAKYFYVCEWTR